MFLLGLKAYTVLWNHVTFQNSEHLDWVCLHYYEVFVTLEECFHFVWVKMYIDINNVTLDI
jgi:hypothetical protein